MKAPDASFRVISKRTGSVCITMLEISVPSPNTVQLAVFVVKAVIAVRNMILSLNIQDIIYILHMCLLDIQNCMLVYSEAFEDSYQYQPTSCF